jgi:parallel beta-helix repeat protein
MKKILAVVVFSFVFLGLASISAAYSIRDDATGGDCSTIGIWDYENKTCTLTIDVYDFIIVESDFISLDGNGYAVIGTNIYSDISGIYLSSRTGVVVKRLTVKKFKKAFELYKSNSNIIVENNIAEFLEAGIFLEESSNNAIDKNNIENSQYFGIYLYNLSNYNTVSENVIVGNKHGTGIGLYVSSNNVVVNNALRENLYGILLTSSSNSNTLEKNMASNNLDGIIVGNSQGNRIIGNTIKNNSVYGLYFGYSRIDNVVLDNTLCGNGHDFYCYYSEIGLEDGNICNIQHSYPSGCSLNCIPCGGPDTTPPTVTISATPDILWPPNHKLIDVRIDGYAFDDLSGIDSVRIIVTDEYGIYNLSVPDFGSVIQLEAWREGKDKDGRVYTITAIAKDKAGNESIAETKVIVPHDMGK